MSTAVLSEPAKRTVVSQLPRQTLVLDGQAIHIPASVVDLASFRRWADSEDFPEKSPRICYLAGELWIDTSKEQIFSHNQIKAEFSRVRRWQA